MQLSQHVKIWTELFEAKFRFILDKHAPVKTYQMRKNYSPYISVGTKILMAGRDILHEEAVKLGSKEMTAEVKKKSKQIKKEIEKDEKKYYERDFGDGADVTTAWRRANEIMGNSKNLAPTSIKKKNENGEEEIVNNPQKLSIMFNNFFRKKVKNLREKTNQQPSVSPNERLQKWLSQREEPLPLFQLKEITPKMFRGIMKKMKGKRVHGVDWIDSFSLKVSSPLIEECLIHLINLSIRRSSFATRWKPQLIFPFHKKKEKDAIENYRPVSHLVQVGKMVEYAIYPQIVEHFSNNNLFHPNHHGSLTNHSTATAIIQLFDMWFRSS